MFWEKNYNKINCKSGLCPPLCRDPLRPNFFNNISVEARSCALPPPGVWQREAE
jgi:hypothetical protein